MLALRKSLTPSSTFTALRHHAFSIVAAVIVLSELIVVLYSYRSQQTSFSGADECPFGRFYVYELPSRFNFDLLSGDVGGLGPPADDLDGIFPEALIASWHSTDQFALEPIFHRRALHHRCRSGEPSTATAFFFPFYAGLAISRHLWSTPSPTNESSDSRDVDCAGALTWLEAQPEFRRSGGRDHFVALGRITWDFRRSRKGDWGSSFLQMRGMRHVTRLVIEKDPWDPLDVGVPYPTGFHPRKGSEVRDLQRFVLNRTRPTLFGFAGAARLSFKDDFRGLLHRLCAAASNGTCRSIDCGVAGRCGKRSGEVLRLYLSSQFCLQPRGDSFTRRSLFDCMVAGAVPVFFWRRSVKAQYSMYLPKENVNRRWSVFIDRRKVRNDEARVERVLSAIPEEKVRVMRGRVVSLIPRLIYASRKIEDGSRDAADVAIDGVLRRLLLRNSFNDSG